MQERTRSSDGALFRAWDFDAIAVAEADSSPGDRHGLDDLPREQNHRRALDDVLPTASIPPSDGVAARA